MGVIPTQLCTLSNLQDILIQRNQFTGPIPSCIGQLTRLDRFVASENLLTGTLPHEISSMGKKLAKLYVDDNLLTGDPTKSINQLVNLRELYLDNNRFEGLLDSDFAKNLNELEDMDLSNNNFSSLDGAAAFPFHLLNNTNLLVLDLSKNKLKGFFPDDTLSSSSKLIFLSLHNNQITGTLPRKVLSGLDRLLHLDLSHNSFTGLMHHNLFALPKVGNLFLGENPGLTAGDLPLAVIANMSKTQLYELSLQNTNRRGPLPDFADFSKLRMIDFDNNDMSGTIPSTYGRLYSIFYLFLSRNPKLSGTIPAFDLSRTAALRVALLDGTNLTGSFETLCKLPAFSPRQYDFRGVEEFLVADAGDQITCSCCQRCKEDAAPGEGCSTPIVESLDWSWERGFTRIARDFSINKTVLTENPHEGRSP